MQGMTSTARNKLVKLLGMLGSDNRGERANAGQKIDELAKLLDISWDELLTPTQGLPMNVQATVPARQASLSDDPFVTEAFKGFLDYRGWCHFTGWLHRVKDGFTDEEIAFVADITNRRFDLITAADRARFDALYDRYQNREHWIDDGYLSLIAVIREDRGEDDVPDDAISEDDYSFACEVFHKRQSEVTSEEKNRIADIYEKLAPHVAAYHQRIVDDIRTGTVRVPDWFCEMKAQQTGSNSKPRLVTSE